MSIRVLIADDHPVVRDGLRLTIEGAGTEIVVVGQASDGMEVLKLARSTPVDVYVLDITMPKMNGIDTTRTLLKKFPAARIIIMSLHDTKVVLEESLAAGARGFLSKEMVTRTVLDAITEVHAGRYFLCPRVIHFAIESGLLGKRPPRKRGDASVILTAQERKVLQLLSEGQSNKEIAATLGRAVNTIHAQRNSVMAKLNLHKQADLIRYAIKAGIAKL